MQESFPNLPISVQVLDGMPLALQAAVYSNASIVVQAHGAALGEPPPFLAGFSRVFQKFRWPLRQISSSDSYSVSETLLDIGSTCFVPPKECLVKQGFRYLISLLSMTIYIL